MSSISTHGYERTVMVVAGGETGKVRKQTEYTILVQPQNASGGLPRGVCECVSV